MTIQIIVPDWPVPSGISAGSTTRAGGVSSGNFESLNLGEHVGDDLRCVRQNRRRFVAAAGLPSEPVWLHQTHSTNTAIDKPDSADSDTDALVTRELGRVAIVMTADCLPVLLAASDGGVVGAAHAGWRGLCGGVLEDAIAKMAVPAASLLVWLGPAISQRAFEVGPEVREKFVRQDERSAVHFCANDRGRFQADLYGLATSRLLAAGVRQVYGGGYCTFGESGRFFSYRRDGECGRQATYIYRRPNA